MTTSFFRSALCLACGLMLAAGPASADSFPTKPVNLMVPYPAGGPSDATARIFTVPLGKALGQQVIVENLGGVSGAMAAQKAVMVFVARKDLPANSVDELIALARKSADKPLSYGSVGIGSLYHLILEKVQLDTGVKLMHAPYKGNAPLLQDIGGGQVDFAVLVYSAAMGALAEQGRLKILGQLGGQRSELLKNVPTASEGKELKNVNSKTWSGFFVRKNTPEDVVQKLHQAIGATLKETSVREQLAAQTQQASPSTTLAESAKFYEAETARYRDIAKSIRLEPQ